MRIVFAASECVPYVNTGGLADVIGALPREVAKQGHQVTTYLPFYRQMSAKMKERVVAIRSLTIPFQYYNRFATVLDGGVQDGVQYYFIDCPELFDREYIYATPTGDYQDNWERFGLFSRAVLESAKVLGVPDVFHAHDWETALIPLYLRTSYYFDPLLSKAGTMLTVHNAGFPGMVSAGDGGAAAVAVGHLYSGSRRALQPAELPQGRSGVFGHGDDGEPQICGGDPDGGVWQWT